MLAGFRATHHQSPPEEFLVVQFLHGTFGFLDGLHLYKGKTLGALVVPVAYNLRILHVPYAVKQFKEIALSSVKREVADIKTRRCDFNNLRFSRWARRVRTIACGRCSFLCGATVSKKFDHPLPECLFLSFRCSLLTPKSFVISFASAPTARAA